MNHPGLTWGMWFLLVGRMLPSDTEDLHLALLRQTLSYAVSNTRYYSETLAGFHLDLQSMDDLRALPILKRADLASRSLDLLAAGTVPEYVRLTSGKTFGESTSVPLIYYNTESERSAETDIYNQLFGSVLSDRPLILKLINANHGLDLAGGRPGVFSLPLEHRYHFEAILSVLRGDFSFPDLSRRVQVLTGSVNLLRLLTLLCVEKDIASDQFDIQYVSSHSWHLTPRWKSLLEEYWKAHVDEIYGLSEVPGLYANRCLDCGHFHFAPLCVTEFLHLTGNEPVTTGFARLVATALYPLSQAQPLIRYDTGDIIELTGVCAAGLSHGFEFVGRRNDLIVLDDSNSPEVVLTTKALINVMDDFPDIASEDNPRARFLGLRTLFGWPKYRVTTTTVSSVCQIALDVELRWSPYQYPKAAINLKDNIRNKLINSSPRLEANLARGSVALNISLYEPGTTDFAAFY